MKPLVSRLAVDLMGAEASPLELWQAAMAALELLPEPFSLSIIATQEAWESIGTAGHRRCEPIVAEEFIAMDEEPLAALRLKKKSSLRIAVDGLAADEWGAVISCGSTGALVAAAAFWLSPLPGLSRPSLLVELPTATASCYLIDAGAHVELDGALSLEQALFGAIWWRLRHASEARQPRLALLNVGTERYKGDAKRRALFCALEELAGQKGAFEFIGNVEGRILAAGGVDVLLTDGWTGNIFLKATEGAALFLLDQLKQRTASLVEKASSMERAALERSLRSWEYSQYPGALLVGVDRLLLKCHGGAAGESLHHSLIQAASWVRAGLLDRCAEQLAIQAG